MFLGQKYELHVYNGNHSFIPARCFFSSTRICSLRLVWLQSLLVYDSIIGNWNKNKCFNLEEKSSNEVKMFIYLNQSIFRPTVTSITLERNTFKLSLESKFWDELHPRRSLTTNFYVTCTRNYIPNINANKVPMSVFYPSLSLPLTWYASVWFVHC